MANPDEIRPLQKKLDGEVQKVVENFIYYETGFEAVTDTADHPGEATIIRSSPKSYGSLRVEILVKVTERG